MIAFVIGNGPSRRAFDLDRLLGLGKVIGCNEAYRHWSGFDMMASVDGPATKDIEKNFDGTRVYKSKENWYCSDTKQDMGRLVGAYGAGHLAVLASQTIWKPEVLYMIGFDFGGERLYDRRVSSPTNKSWATWDTLMAGNPVVNVNAMNATSKRLHCTTITYQELYKRIKSETLHEIR